MDVINGMPAHALLLHVVVVVAPLTALLEIVCGVWPAARRGQLLWVTLAFAIVTMVFTPLTINAGQWLYDLEPNPSPILREHAARASVMIYFAVALLVAAIALVGLRMIERRSGRPRIITHIVVAIVVLAVGVSSIIQTYRVGDAGSQAVWGGDIARLKNSH